MPSDEMKALLGALVATKNLTIDDAQLHESFLDFVEEVNVDIPDLMCAVDLALDFYCDDPDEEATKVADRIQAAHDHASEIRGVCPDCGEPSMMDIYDEEQSVALWVAVRDVVDKYMFDTMHAIDDGGPEVEEC